MRVRFYRYVLNTAAPTLIATVMAMGTAGCGAINGGGELPAIIPGRSVTIGGAADEADAQPPDGPSTDDALPLDGGEEDQQDATEAGDLEDSGTGTMDADTSEPEADGVAESDESEVALARIFHESA